MSHEDEFDFERLDVFKVSIELVVSVDRITKKLPPGRIYIRDQLRRAANSVALNIAEGAGEFSKPEKARFYRMAKRSATECAGQIAVAQALGVCAPEHGRAARTILRRLVQMLVKLIRACDDPNPP